MPDESMSDGEIRRNFDRLDRTIGDLAKSIVTQDAWTRENGHLRAEITKTGDDCKARTQTVANAVSRIERRSQLTVGRIIALLGVVATLAAGWFAAFAAARGVH